MQIQRLQVTNVRNLSRVTLPLQTINVFYGANGSGKTSLLEAVHLLFMGRSFRQTQLRPLLQDGEDQTVVYAELISPQSSRITLGLSRQRDGSKPSIKLNGETLNLLSELVQIAPVQVLSGDSFEMLTGGPAHRRRFLDWGLFHVEPQFYPAWRLAQRALKQRNSLIRHGKIDREQLLLWTREYARYGEQVDLMRQSYIEDLLPLCRSIARSVLPQLEGDIEAAYVRGWTKEQNLAVVLEQGLEGDLQQGYTRSGPHRADLRITAGQYAAADVLSRGQLKMLVSSLYLAQAEMLALKAGKRSIFLVDDLASELDDAHRRRLCGELERLEVQVLATSIRLSELLDCWTQPGQIQVFHVEHGVVKPVSVNTAQ
jgi:DNA replication and repair protein RecF